MVMSKARVVAGIIVLVVVIWYVINFQHQQSGVHLNPTSITHNPSHQQIIGSNFRTSDYLPTVPTTLHTGKTNQMSNFTHTTPRSFSVEAWESVMRGRLARVARVCQQHGRVLQRFDLFSVFKSLTVDPAHHLIYCRNAKAGTTAWLSRLLSWAGITITNTSTVDIHTTADMTFPMLAPDKILQELRRPSLTFTVARHPFSRLVSAYRNKIQGNYHSELWPKMIRKYRKTPSNYTAANDTRPTFREFVLFASDEVLKCLGKTRPSCLQDVDVHWLPHHDRCAPCNIQYNVIAKMETKDEDEAYISNLLEVSLPSTLQKNVAFGASTASLTKSFFSTLNPSERRHVFKAYEFDFLMFNYSYNDEDYT